MNKYNAFEYILYYRLLSMRGMKKINETFACLGCKKIVPLAQKTCRNHCPFCFTSQHVDGAIP